MKRLAPLKRVSHARVLPYAFLVWGLAGCGIIGLDDVPNDVGVDGAADSRVGAPDLRREMRSPPDTDTGPSVDGALDTAPPPPCEGAGDGVACDSGACTGTCMAGRCEASDCVLADSREDFSDTQGERGWWMGYWNEEDDVDGRYDFASDFTELFHEPTGIPGNRGNWFAADRSRDRGSPEHSWLYIAHYWQHPSTRNGRRSAIRRWVSNRAGPATIRIRDYRTNAGGGDGVRLGVLINGDDVLRLELSGRTTEPTTDSVGVTLDVGMTIDIVLDANIGDNEDTTMLEVEIIGHPSS
ncbi:MAG: hypothetical protein AAF411_21355 [Myxococcota bacterium]